jgi:hypothetical protein
LSREKIIDAHISYHLIKNKEYEENNRSPYAVVDHGNAGTYQPSDTELILWRLSTYIDFDTDNPGDMAHFSVNGKVWVPNTVDVSSKGNAVIQFNVPFNTSSTTATVLAILNDESDGIETTVALAPRTFTQRPLAFYRDLFSPYIDDLTVRKASFKINASPTRYRPYFYSNGILTEAALDSKLNNGDVLVCISNDVTALSQIVHHLQNTNGILKNRRLH